MAKGRNTRALTRIELAHTFADYVRGERERRCWTLEEAAAKLRMDGTSLHSIEQGETVSIPAEILTAFHLAYHEGSRASIIPLLRLALLPYRHRLERVRKAVK